MSPESVTPDAIRRALDAVRPPAQELDDASIACILDHGLEALPSDARALAIRAIATNPAVAAIVVALHEPDAARMALRDLRATQAWRFAFAACTLLASGTTLWMLGGPGSAGAAPELLDSGSPAPTGLSSGIRGVQLLGLMIAWLAAATCFYPAFVRPTLHARLRRSHDRREQAGD